MLRHFISLLDWSAPELRDLIEQAIFLKREYRAGGNHPALQGKTLALIFQRASLRTRISFEMAMQHLGGHALFIGPNEIELGKRESVADVVRTLGRYTHAILARVADHSLLLEMAKWSPVPVINGLSKYSHPCQAMADALTIYEEFGRLPGVAVSFVGDSHNDVTRSLMFAAAKFGFQLTLSSPEGYWMDSDSINKARAIGGEDAVRLIPDPVAAVRKADVIYTDTWTWSGLSETEVAERVRVLSPYQVNETLIAQAPAHAILMHCLPAHRGQEITDGAADGPRARLFDQAENRLHAQKSIVLRLMG